MKHKIVRTFVREEAYETLRDWIVEGKLKPGSKLRDKELALRMGVSRTPIREALLRLEDEGLVKSKPNSSTVVSPIDLQNAHHLYSIAGSLESLALQEAICHLNGEHIREMIEANSKLKDAIRKKDKQAALNADYDFHAVYIELAGNLELSRILQNVKTKLKRIDLYYFEHVKNALRSYEEHEEIIKALKNKNLAAAQNGVIKNWLESFKRIEGEHHVSE